MTKKRKVVCKHAAEVAFAMCENCGCPHLFLFEDNCEEPFAEASLDSETLLEILSEMDIDALRAMLQSQQEHHAKSRLQ
jgi:hypothetical protein